MVSELEPGGGAEACAVEIRVKSILGRGMVNAKPGAGNTLAVVWFSKKARMNC